MEDEAALTGTMVTPRLLSCTEPWPCLTLGVGRGAQAGDPPWAHLTAVTLCVVSSWVLPLGHPPHSEALVVGPWDGGDWVFPMAAAAG